MSMENQTDYSGLTLEPDLVPGFLRGYRSWYVKRRFFLGPTGFDQPMHWVPGVNEAQCFRPRRVGYIFLSGEGEDQDPGTLFGPCGEQSPGVFCGQGTETEGCGFYALHQMDGQGWTDVMGPQWKHPAHNRVYGSVKLTGKIIVGTRGVRAQKAEIESLWLGSSDSILRFRFEGIFNIYNVPFFERVEELCEAFPPIPVNELLEPRQENDLLGIEEE